MGSAKGKIGGALIKNDPKQFKKQFDSDEAGGAPFWWREGRHHQGPARQQWRLCHQKRH